jgi:hypothetical protein
MKPVSSEHCTLPLVSSNELSRRILLTFEFSGAQAAARSALPLFVSSPTLGLGALLGEASSNMVLCLLLAFSLLTLFLTLKT